MILTFLSPESHGPGRDPDSGRAVRVRVHRRQRREADTSCAPACVVVVVVVVAAAAVAMDPVRSVLQVLEGNSAAAAAACVAGSGRTRSHSAGDHLKT